MFQTAEGIKKMSIISILIRGVAEIRYDYGKIGAFTSAASLYNPLATSPNS
jgi:hypothetical protein